MSYAALRRWSSSRLHAKAVQVKEELVSSTVMRQTFIREVVWDVTRHASAVRMQCGLVVMVDA